MNLQERISIPIAFLSEMNLYTIYFHQYMHKEDSAGFIEAVVK